MRDHRSMGSCLKGSISYSRLLYTQPTRTKNSRNMISGSISRSSSLMMFSSIKKSKVYSHIPNLDKNAARFFQAFQISHTTDRFPFPRPCSMDDSGRKNVARMRELEAAYRAHDARLWMNQMIRDNYRERMMYTLTMPRCVQGRQRVSTPFRSRRYTFRTLQYLYCRCREGQRVHIYTYIGRQLSTRIVTRA